ALLLARGATQDELARHIFDATVEQTRATDAALADLLPLAAIPRRLDAEVIGALRDAPADTDENARLLAALLPFTFVVARRDAGYVYHDTTRDMLLHQWRSGSDAERAQFDAINQ